MIQIKNIKSAKFAAIQEFLNLNFLFDKIILAGGSLRTLINPDDKVVDYDLFFIGEEIEGAKNNLQQKIFDLGGKKIFQCKKDELRSFKLGEMKIQFISIQSIKYHSIEELLNSFDINASRFAFDGEKLYCFKESVADIFHNHISLNIVTYPTATLKRIAKYWEKGFKITRASKEFVRQVRDNGVDMDEEIVYVD
jgi:hypothetical protein